MFEIGYLSSFFATIFIECTVAWLFGLRTLKSQFGVCCVNAITHPLFHYLLFLNSYFLLVQNSPILYSSAETLIIFVEYGLLTFTLGTQQARYLFFIAVLMNLASFLFGEALILQRVMM